MVRFANSSTGDCNFTSTTSPTVFFLQSGPAGQAVSGNALWGHLAYGRSPFFPFLILNSYTHLRPLRMAVAHLFPNAHDFVISGGKFYVADTVSGTVRYSPSNLMALDLLQITLHEEQSIQSGIKVNIKFFN